MSDDIEQAAGETPTAVASATSSGKYKVGYKKPPQHTRFKPGQSGNPKGRRRGSENVKTMVRRTVNEKVSVREGDKTRQMTKLEAGLQAQLLKAMKGDPRGFTAMLNVVQRTGLFDDEDKPSHGVPANRRSVSDALFENVNPDLLTRDDMIELSRLASIIDLGGDITALNSADFERLKAIVNKGRGRDVTPDTSSSF
jgi:hypothetical protein